MNMQTLMKQAQAMQKKMLSEKNKIDETIFEGNSELVKVKMKGNRKIVSIEIDKNASLDGEDLEILEDMIAIAVNDVLGKIENEISAKIGGQTGGLEGLF